MILRYLLSILTFLLTASHAARLTVEIAGSPTLANPSTLPPSTHAVLLGPPGTRHDVPLRRDNTFLFPNLSTGSYLLTIHTLNYNFAPLRVDITTQADAGSASAESINVWQTFRGNEWSNKGPLLGTSSSGELKLQIRGAGVKEYYQQRQGFSIVAFLKSPMILMALVSGVMIFGFPYLMENMDEETKKEFQDISSRGPVMGSEGAASQIQNFDLASWMAGKTSGSSGSGTSTPTGGGGGESRKKR